MSNLAELIHLDLPLLLASTELHNRWLNQWYQGHIRICRYSNSSQKIWSHLGCHVDSSRTISTADDTNCRCLLSSKAQAHSTSQGNKYTELSSCAHEQGIWISQKRAKVRHSTYTKENQWWENLVLNTIIDYLHNTRLLQEAGSREVSHNTTKCNRSQKQWLVLLANSHVQQDNTYNDHCQIT